MNQEIILFEQWPCNCAKLKVLFKIVTIIISILRHFFFDFSTVYIYAM